MAMGMGTVRLLPRRSLCPIRMGKMRSIESGFKSCHSDFYLTQFAPMGERRRGFEFPEDQVVSEILPFDRPRSWATISVRSVIYIRLMVRVFTNSASTLSTAEASTWDKHKASAAGLLAKFSQ
jgi:hypothetical protein